LLLAKIPVTDLEIAAPTEVPVAMIMEAANTTVAATAQATAVMGLE